MYYCQMSLDRRSLLKYNSRVEDSADRQGARARAYELRKLGLEQRLESLQRDADLDVRERAKQASATLGDLLKGGM